MVVQSAALAGHPGQQPHLVAGAGAQPVVPAGGRVVLGRGAPTGRGRRRWSGRGRRTRPRWPGARAAAGGGAGLRGCRRRSGGRCRCSWVRWFLGGERCRVSRTVRPGHGRRSARMRARDSSRVERTGAAGAREAQQLEQQQQQRAWTAPRNPAVRVEVSAEFASMPTRTAVHTRTVNSMPDLGAMFHLIRFICAGERFVQRATGTHGAQPGARRRRRGSRDRTVIRFASVARIATRSNSWASSPVRGADAGAQACWHVSRFMPI